MLLRFLLSFGVIPWLVHSLAPTDEISDADPPQSGYLPNHNMQPAIVGSPSFGILWTNTYNDKEKWYAKPLVYTPPGQKQLVFTASSQNWIRTVDAVTGAALKSRQVMPPFLASELGCGDMPNTVGISGTPVIDPNTNTAYFFAKGYKNEASSGGVANGVYKFYAVNVLDLTDRPGFPVLIDGHNADNDPARYFIGGTVLQRPSLTMIGSTVYGTFGGHCDLFNYTGMIAALSTTPGVGVTNLFAMESSPGAPPVQSDIFKQVGGKAGIWMSGMPPATDGSRIFVVTGNGGGHENKDTPASGRSPLSTLDEVVANFDVSGGKLQLQDYFEPYEYIGMDAADRDLGAGGVALLDPTVFKGTNGVNRLAVTIGKNGKAYIMNADNLGGYKLGPGATDNVIQTIITDNAIFGGVGSYPLEGGYIYFTPNGFPTMVYKIGHDQSGAPLFSKVGQSPDRSAGRVGVGVPTVTTYKGQPGTGIVWVTDVEAGLRAYKAVPDSSGNLIRINIPPTGRLNKFQRPAFGDGRVYVTDNNARVICLGSPVSLPLNCTSPLDFGDVIFGSIKTLKVDCTALINITKINGASTLDPNFQVSNASLPQGALAAGATFSFPVTWNLTKEGVKDETGASFGAVTPGVKSSSLVISTTNAVKGFSDNLPIPLQGNEVSKAPFLSISPAEVDLGGIVVGSPGAATGLDSSFILANIGSSALKITGIGWTVREDEDDDDAEFKNVTTQGGISIIGNSFTSSDFPAVGSLINPGQSISVPVKFKSTQVGFYQSILEFWTTGGNKNVLFTASATTAPIAELAVETSEGGWDTSGIMDFGTVLAGSTVTRRIRICNKGGSPLLITKSKPPVQAELRAENPNQDLHEGQSIAAGECAYGPIDIAAAPQAPNNPPHDVSDEWVLNTDDLKFGVHEVEVKATIVSRQLGPTFDNGTARYRYLGCYRDQPRQFQKSYNLGQNNDNAACQKQCLANGYAFAATEYHIECWCGNKPPSAAVFTPESAKKCTFACSGDKLQACGGDGTYASVFYDSSKYTPGCESKPCPTTSSSTSISSASSTSKSSTSSASSTSKSSTSSSTTSSSSTSSTSSKPSSSSSTSSKPSSSSSSTSSKPSSSSSSTSSKPSASSSSTSSKPSSSSSSTSSSSSSASSTSSRSSASSSSTSSSSSASSTSSRSSTSSLPSTMSTRSSSTPFTVPSPTGTPTSGFYSLGCFLESTKRRWNNLILAAETMSPEICISAAQAKLSANPPVTYRVLGLEYGRECWGATSALPSQTSLIGDMACTKPCSGDKSQSCGAWSQYNYYATTSGLPTSTTSVPVKTTGVVKTTVSSTK